MLTKHSWSGDFGIAVSEMLSFNEQSNLFFPSLFLAIQKCFVGSVVTDTLYGSLRNVLEKSPISFSGKLMVSSEMLPLNVYSSIRLMRDSLDMLTSRSLVHPSNVCRFSSVICGGMLMFSIDEPVNELFSIISSFDLSISMRNSFRNMQLSNALLPMYLVLFDNLNDKRPVS